MTASKLEGTLNRLRYAAETASWSYYAWIYGGVAIVLALPWLLFAVSPPEAGGAPWFAIGSTFFVAMIFVVSLAGVVRSDQWTDGDDLYVKLIYAVSMVSSYLAQFAQLHFYVSAIEPHSYSEHLTVLSASYLTVTTFTTTGFGDIRPMSSGARLLATAQMASGFIVVTVLIGLILGRVLLSVSNNQK